MRNEVSLRVHSLSESDPDPTVFDCLIPYLNTFLRKQHAQFVSSDEFFKVYNQVADSSAKSLLGPPTSSSFRGKPRKSFTYQPILTAEMLLKTQYVRENTLGERYVSLPVY